MAALSYTHGASEFPLLGETIATAYAQWLAKMPEAIGEESLEGFPAGALRVQIGRELIRILLESESMEEDLRRRPVTALMGLDSQEVLDEIQNLLSHADPFVRLCL